nr:hypothetical protein CFP56_26055 [Quercus suber]
MADVVVERIRADRQKLMWRSTTGEGGGGAAINGFTTGPFGHRQSYPKCSIAMENRSNLTLHFKALDVSSDLRRARRSDVLTEMNIQIRSPRTTFESSSSDSLVISHHVGFRHPTPEPPPAAFQACI